MLRQFSLVLCIAIASLTTAREGLRAAAGKTFLTYIGTYTGERSKGIYVCRFDTATGKATPPELAVEVVSPSFLALHPNGKFLYAVNEVSKFRGEATGVVSAFSIDRKTGKLSLLNQEPAQGAGPCHLVVDTTGKLVLVANYGGGTFAALKLGEDGRVQPSHWNYKPSGSSANKGRQEAPHAHCVSIDPSNRFALGADLGTDTVWVFRLDSATGKVELGTGHPVLKPGSGPRHTAFRPDGKFAYVINELDCTLSAFAFDADKGTLQALATISTLPGPFQAGYSTAELEAHASGKFLYGSNRGHNSIVVCAIDATTGKLTAVQHEPSGGKTPRSFGIDPTGGYLLAANQDSDTIVVFKLDPQTGKLSATGEVIAAPTPVCVKFLAAE